MHTLTLKDLDISEQLDSTAMASVRGGCGYKPASCWQPAYYPVYCPPMPTYCDPKPTYCEPTQYGVPKDMTANASQSLSQCQNTVVNNGNNAAYV